eukprot:scaffold2021_cov89-Skeletonema_dohrnii-CCMP3373.AAC.1
MTKAGGKTEECWRKGAMIWRKGVVHIWGGRHGTRLPTEATLIHDAMCYVCTTGVRQRVETPSRVPFASLAIANTRYMGQMLGDGSKSTLMFIASY